MSPLSNVQFSRFTENEFAKLLTFGTSGLLEVMLPASDDERRDIETHIKEHFGISLAVQVKARHVLILRGKAKHLWIRFDEKKERVITDPFFWYFFGYMDLRTMAYQAPVFPIPSEVVHRLADPRIRGDMVRFTLDASMDPNSHDQWRPYACAPDEVGQRMLEVLKQEPLRAARVMSPALAGLPGLIWVRKRLAIR